MNVRRLFGVVLALAAAGAVVWLWPREPLPPEEQVRRKVVQMQAAAEARDVGEVMEGVSERFRTDRGWDREDLRRVLLGHLLRGQWVRLFSSLEPRALSDSEVAVSGRLLFASAKAERLEDLPRASVMNAFAVDAVFKKEADGEWRCTSASYRPLDVNQLL